jgi:sugar lactone lactonase YvrE
MGVLGAMSIAPLLFLAACARTPEPVAAPAAPLFFPPPPAPARVLYLGAINSAQDLPSRRGGFADFVLGPEPRRFPLAKPSNALLAGHKLYITDTTFNRVFIYDLVSGEASAPAGDRGNGKIGQPNNIDLDEAGNLYVADKLRQAVLVFGPDGAFLHAWGRPGEVAPVDVKVGAKYLYVCDIDGNQIELWDRATGELVKVVGELGNAPGEFFKPTHLALDGEGNVYVTDAFNFRVQKFSPEGVLLGAFGRHGDALGSFALPKGIGVDGRGRIYVADSRFCNVQIFDPEFRLLLFFGGPGVDNGNLDLPAGLRVVPWPGDIPLLNERLTPGFDPEFLAIVVSQKGAGFINFFAVARTGSE